MDAFTGLLFGEKNSGADVTAENSRACQTGDSRIVPGGGGYVYKQYADGTVEIVKGPRNKGKIYGPTHPVGRAITSEIGAYPKQQACSKTTNETSAKDDERSWHDIPSALKNGEIDWIQARLDTLTGQAKAEEDFSASDKEFLTDLYWWLAVGGYGKGLYEASKLQRHYIEGSGRELKVSSTVYEQSTIVQYAMAEMKKVMAADLKSKGAIRNGGNLSSTDVLGKTNLGDQARLGEIIKGGYLLAEQDNKRLKYCNNRFALKAFTEVKEGFWFWEPDRFIETRWRVDDTWDFASFPEQKKARRNDVSHIPLPNGAVLKLHDGLSAYLTEQNLAAVFPYFSEWTERWQAGDLK